MRYAHWLCIIATLTTGMTSALAQEGDTHRQQQVLFEGQVQVPPGGFHQITFTTNSNFRNARMAGNVHARGGAGNDIRVLVSKGQSVVYDSGHRRSVVMSVDGSEPGEHTLMFDNASPSYPQRS